ncbi:MAG: AarF/ABC1/UbiB kinase family protein [bacterium]|nr:AarF/ABC1/UbiB kinase family protein [bacterium]
MPKPEDDFSLDQGAGITQKIQRYAKVTQTVGGAAARWAGSKYLGVGTNHDSYATALTKMLGGLKGPLMKVAQLLSTIPGALPPEYAKQLAALQSQAPAMGWLFVRRRMRSELGSGWESHFENFSKEAAAAASLGQVHKAVTKEGQLVACKLQYPDMESVISSDLGQLKMFLNLYETFNKALQTDDVFAEISERLKEELDYHREAENLAHYREITKDLKDVHVPAVVPELSTQRLLTMSWMEGQSLLSFLEESPPLEERNKVAKTLFWAWYFPFYGHHTIHGDPHLGNYTLRPDGGINLLDFGCVRHFSPTFVEGVLELYQGLLHNNQKRCLQAYEMWGFENISEELLGILNIWARFLYAPLLEDKVQTIEAPHEGKAGREVVGKMLDELSKAGGVRPPREFVLMDRAAVGIGAAFMHLGAELNWHQEFESLLDAIKGKTSLPD